MNVNSMKVLEMTFSSDTRNSTKKHIQMLGMQQYPETSGQLGSYMFIAGIDSKRK